MHTTYGYGKEFRKIGTIKAENRHSGHLILQDNGSSHGGQ